MITPQSYHADFAKNGLTYGENLYHLRLQFPTDLASICDPVSVYNCIRDITIDVLTTQMYLLVEITACLNFFLTPM